MDRLIKYQEAVISALEEYAALPINNKPNVERQVVADRVRNRYLVINFGWETEDNLTYSTSLHLEIKKGKVWIQQNWTEYLIATELKNRGVLDSDIILGFIPEYAREEFEFEFA